MGDRAFLLHYRTDAVGSCSSPSASRRAPLCRRAAPARTEQCARIVLLRRRAAAPGRALPPGRRRLRAAASRSRRCSTRCSPQPTPAELVELRGVRRVSAARAAHRARRHDASIRARSLADTPLSEAARDDGAHRARRAARWSTTSGASSGWSASASCIRHLLTTQVFSGADVRAVPRRRPAPRTVRDVMTR